MSTKNLSSSRPAVRRLRQGEFLRFRRPHRLCLRAERGTLWITVDGKDEDIILDQGRSRIFEGEAAVFVGTAGGKAALSAVPLGGTAPGWREWLAAGLGRMSTLVGT